MTNLSAVPAHITETALVLRTTDANLRSYGGFQWPSEIGARVEAPDWKPTPECGDGLHGWLYGQGDNSSASIRDDSKWMVVQVALAEVVMLGGKCKFPRCVVCFIGDMKGAADYILTHEPRSASVAVIGASLVVGDNEAATVGALGTATAGDSGTAMAGYRGTAMAGDSGTVCIRWWDEKKQRYRTEVVYVDEDGIKANTPYHLNDAHKFEEVKP